MKQVYTYLVILSISLLFSGRSDLFAQSYDVESVESALCQIHHEDQQIRHKFIAAMQNPTIELLTIQRAMDSIDSLNQRYVSDLLDQKGWPKHISDSANKAIFLVIDHAEKSYSERYFKKVKEKAEQGVISKSDAATLEDRILMRAGKPQKYGTQTRIYHKTEDMLYVWPIEDAENVDQRRAAVDLLPLENYMQLLEDVYHMPVLWDKSLTVSFFDEKSDE